MIFLINYLIKPNESNKPEIGGHTSLVINRVLKILIKTMKPKCSNKKQKYKRKKEEKEKENISVYI